MNHNQLAERSSYWDIAKGILIFLVVFGHNIYAYNTSYPVKYIIEIIFFFHMPAFIFIAGHFSRSKNASSLKSLTKLLILYVVFNSAFIVYESVIKQNYVLLTPYYSYWFIIALVIWRLITKHFTPKLFWIPISLVFSLLIGFWGDIDNTLALSRTIAFLPFFLAGYCLPDEVSKRYFEKKDPKTVVIGIVVLILFFGCVLFLSSQTPSSLLSYLMMYTYTKDGDILIRIIALGIGAVITMALFPVVPSKLSRFGILERIGRNSLWIFVLHRPITLAFTKIYGPYNNYLLPIALFVSVIMVLFLSSDFVVVPLNRLLEKATSRIVDNSPVSRTPKLSARAVVVIVALVILLSPIAGKAYNRYFTDSSKQISSDQIYTEMTDELQNRFDNAVSIAFVGDLIMLQDQVRSGYDKESGTYNYSAMFEYAAGYLSEADYAIGVYEGPSSGESAGYTTSNYDDGLPVSLNFPDSFADAVRAAGIDFVTTANNHLLDKGVDGALRTLDVLDKSGLDHTGSYRNQHEKDEIKIINVQGMRIAVLAYTYGSNNVDDKYFLSEKTSYITSVLAEPDSSTFNQVKSSVEEDFKKAKEVNPDMIIVLPHVGSQFTHKPSNYQNTWNDIFAASGADIIFEDHPHAVQPIEFKTTRGPKGKDHSTLIVNCPGNFANSYTKHDGDVTAIVEAYIDPEACELVGAAVIPMWTQVNSDHSARALPVYDIFNNKSLKDQLGQLEIDRASKTCSIATSVMLDAEIKADQLGKRCYITSKGYVRNKVVPLTLSEDMKKTDLYALLQPANKVCFVGDSITAGTKNGGYGWFEPLARAFNFKYTKQAFGGATTRDLINKLDQIAAEDADVYIIAIGTNDVRYRDKNKGAIDKNKYIENLETITEGILDVNPKVDLVFITPWLAQDNDPICKVSNKERDKLISDYSDALKVYCTENSYVFINANPLIDEVLTLYPPSEYLVDYIHPNAAEGIRLYSQMVFEASPHK